MNNLIETLPKGVALGDTPQILSLIHSCSAVIWRRLPLERFQFWIDHLDPLKLPSARVILPVGRVHDLMQQICEASGTPECAERSMLIDDIAVLAEIFCEIFSASFLRLRLDVVESNACRKFHVDVLQARLICTYRGNGTQYTSNADGIDTQQIHEVPTGTPILLRGTLWQGDAEPAVYHRSPPIEGTGQTRLVLVLDPVEEPEYLTDQNTITYSHIM